MRRFYTFLILFLFSQQLVAQNYDANKMRYIEQFKYWAMDEQTRTGVPAAISLAQGILETGAGSSELCTEANNHFGIKCKKEWEGDTYLHDDDKRSECFRKYKSAKDSYLDHSNFLRDRAHYASLFTLDVTDYSGWCHGLRKAGYATNPQYAIRLIDLIEEYNLQQYTHEAIEIAKDNNLAKEVVPIADKRTDEIVTSGQTIAKTTNAKIKQIDKESALREEKKVVYDKLMVKNGRNGFWARKGDYLLPEAVQYNIRYAKLLDLNDLEDEPLKEDMFIYLKRKAKKGDRMYHRVKEGESMHSISQNSGVILKYLYDYNNMYEGEEPAAEEKIYLQSKSSKTPKLVSKGAVVIKETIVTKTKVVESKKVEQPKTKETVVVKKTGNVEKVEIKKEIAKEAVKEIIETKSEVEIAKKAEEKLTEKVTEKEVVAEVKKVEIVVKDEQAMLEKERRIESTEKSSSTVISVVGVKKDTPILNIDKAKKVEELMGDGNKEIERLYYDTSVKTGQETNVVIEEKAVPAPATNNKKLEADKAVKNNAKQNEKRTYKDENVSDDVKNLKKKFDTLIYDDE